MQMHSVATPFGRRAMSLGLMATQVLAQAAPKEAVVHKWRVFQYIREIHGRLGASDRAVAILNALLSFHPDTTLTGDGDLIVWPSNEQLASRANGMSATTLRRHLTVLVDCGLIIRRDSPNGKRYARKGRGGEIEQAFGFDLSPIVARAAEFEQLAEEVQAERAAFRVARERLTLLRRDIAKMILAGVDEGVPGDWKALQWRYEATMIRLPRSPSMAVLEEVCAELRLLWCEVHNLFEAFLNSQKMNTNESQSGAHLQNSNPDSILESEKGFRERNEANGTVEITDNVRSLPQREMPLSMVIDACPNIAEMSPDRTIRYWRDLVTAANKARPMLQISPSAWKEACEIMGDNAAAITLAAILERSDQIKSAGGYLRSLVERAKGGKFSIWPMVMALLRSKLEREKASSGAATSLSARSIPNGNNYDSGPDERDRPRRWDG